MGWKKFSLLLVENQVTGEFSLDVKEVFIFLSGEEAFAFSGDYPCERIFFFSVVKNSSVWQVFFFFL